MYRALPVLLVSLALLFGQSEHVRRGVEAQQRRELQLAIQEFEKAVALFPEYSVALANLAVLWLCAGI